MKTYLSNFVYHDCQFNNKQFSLIKDKMIQNKFKCFKVIFKIKIYSETKGTKIKARQQQKYTIYLSKMQTYNTNQHQLDSSHTFEVKPIQASHPIYMNSTQTQRVHQTQKISQQIDLKNIAILISTKAFIILLYYLLGSFKLFDFIFITLLISVDFWMNKNIYGKQLAGLRWWIQLDEYSEEQHWVFESAEPNININGINNGVFWITNLIVAIFWFINLLVISIITTSLFWVSLCIFALGMTLINMGCFYKCRGNHQKKLSELIERVGFKSATNLLANTHEMKDTNTYQQNRFQIQ